MAASPPLASPNAGEREGHAAGEEKRLQAHSWRRRMGLRCLTVRISDREVRYLISTATFLWRAVGRRRTLGSLLRLGFLTI